MMMDDSSRCLCLTLQYIFLLCAEYVCLSSICDCSDHGVTHCLFEDDNNMVLLLLLPYLRSNHGQDSVPMAAFGDHRHHRPTAILIGTLSLGSKVAEIAIDTTKK